MAAHHHRKRGGLRGPAPSGGLTVLSDPTPGGLVAEQPITPGRDDRSHRLLRQVTLVPDADSRAQRADALIGDLLRERPPTDRQRLANRALDHPTEQPRVRPVADVAAHLRMSPHSFQRALAGLGYVDQAHLTNEFRTVICMTPGAYTDALRQAG